MSLELHVLLTQRNFPTRDAWQKSIDAIGLPIRLYSSLESRSNVGFVPVDVEGGASGFELYFDDVAELISVYPKLKTLAADRNAALSFRWGGDLKECGCVLAAAAALLKDFDAIAYYPSDDIVYRDFQQVVEEAKQCF